MRILHLADRLSQRGGADQWLLAVLEAQASDHRIRLAVGRDDGTALAPCPLDVVPGLDSRVRAEVALDRLLHAARPDALHVHNLVNPAVLEWAAKHGAVATVHDHRFFCPGRGKWTSDGQACYEAMRPELCEGCFDDESYFREIYALTGERLTALKRMRLTVLSDYMKRELEQVGIAAARITVVPPFVHGLDAAAPAEGSPCVLFVGRLVEAKGVRDAVEAWGRAGTGLPLVFAGTGPLRDELEQRGFEVLGRRAAVVVLPSRWQEPFGIVGLEALTLGTPVAAWDGGGVREWHPGRGLARWGDLDGLAAAIRDAVGRKGKTPRGFERERAIRRLESVYRSQR